MRLLGIHAWIGGFQVIHGTGKWLALDADLVMRDGQVVGTKNPTGHELLIDARFELPYGM